VAADYDGTDEFRGASFTGADFTGANFRDCDLRQAKITDSWLVDVSLSGLVGNLVVNDVDVTAFVEGELDKRHPERVQLREMRTVDDYRAMWHMIERLWAETVARAERLPEPALHQRVDDDGLTDDDLERECPRLPAPGYPEETYTLGRCLRVVMKEECEHRRYAVRDLATLEAGPGAGAAHHDPPP
jgi:hypothetical protein